MKWIEVNIGVKENNKHKILLEFVAPLIEKMKTKSKSWHFLWEGKPWPKDKGTGITLRLRFFGENGLIEQIKQEIERELTMLEEEKPELYLGHCFGRHGECGKDYEGEADDWGTEAWGTWHKISEFRIRGSLSLD